jgi:hypothetical protein
MSGRTDFNGDLFKSELLTIEDEAENPNIQARRAMASAIKMMTVNEFQSLHAKGRQALTVVVFQRVVITLNNEPERLLVLPPMSPTLKTREGYFWSRSIPCRCPPLPPRSRDCFGTR